MDVTPHDLRAFFRSVGKFSGQRALNTVSVDRYEPTVPAELLDDTISKVNAEPLRVDAFIDGIQASLIVTHRAHRPVYLSYVAAGALGVNAKCVGMQEDLKIVGSILDKEWVSTLDTTIPFTALTDITPPEVERTASLLLSTDRSFLEQQLVAELVKKLTKSNSGCLALDGSLANRDYNTSLVGIVKTTGKKYLADESCLFGLPKGFRSPRFKIPAGSAGSSLDRYSTYVRLFDASDKPWNFGLIRLEAFTPDILDSFAARCLLERQTAGSNDSRWDRHLASVRACEEYLRARRPAVFAM